MSARQKVAKRNTLEKTEAPLISIISALGIALFLLIFPYDRGMFNGYEFSFEPILNTASIYSFILLIIVAFYFIRKWQLNSYTSLLSILILILPLLYWISSFNAVSSYNAKFTIVIYAMFAALFIISLYAAQTKLSQTIIESGIMLSGFIIVLFGLFNLFGQIFVKDALWLAHDGYRLSSVFQYSNAYAGFLIALFLATAYYAVHSSTTRSRMFHAAMLAPIWISFMMTFSRGAIVIIPVVIILIIPFLRLSKQIAYLAFLAISILASMLVLGKMTENTIEIAKIVQPTAEKAPDTISMFSSLAIQSWGLLFAAILITLAFTWLYHAKVDSWVETRLMKFAERKWSSLSISGAIVIVSTLLMTLLFSSSAIRDLLPAQLSDRIANINLQQHSVLERLTFYKDGLRASQDYPLLGAGGGAWQSIYEQYQNNPYNSRQAHSFFVQVLVEIGWVGFITLFGLIAFIYFLYIRSHIRHPELRGSHLVFFILSLTILMHSAIDFDMSYVYIAAIVFISLGAMLAPYHEKLTIDRLNKLTTQSWRRSVYPVSLIIMSLVLIVIAIQNNRAVTNFTQTLDQASKQQVPFNQLLAGLDKSMKIAPSQTTYAVTKVNWLLQGYEQSKDPKILALAIETVNEAAKKDSYSRAIFEYQIKLLHINNQIVESLPVIEETLVKFPWDITTYERAMTTYALAHGSAVAAGDNTKPAQYEERIDEITKEVQRRIDLLATLPPEQFQGRNFAFTEPMKAVITSMK
ncbi:O-antigen ligase family protein [Paenibacillus sp. GSMTC-2017]|uniref:O-antigen ligase family protein n=1 Tax=Paenibacillus sp. GSMTC-2017 TaxID=2794350 RepID=UPI0018D74E00|nr:O-antigen ligase family protein [Paenibacillus sp. GSMTC-2017]MBH5319137.1 O-antigen ligase family protein [Paenibacillus sp. GSMTC-2017]